MTRMRAGRAVALAAGELAEASTALHAIERALLTDARPADVDAFPQDLQHLDLLAQSIEELRNYLDRIALALEPDAFEIDLTAPLSAVKLGAMRARLSDGGAGSLATPAPGSVDLF